MILRLSPLLPCLALALQAAPPDREAILKAARALMGSQPYCALATLDADGHPTVRTMNPIAPEEDFTVYFATHDESRKVGEFQKHPQVTIYYANHARAEGFVALHGKATLVQDPAEIQKRKRAYWDQAFPGLKHLGLIKVVPVKLEIVSYKDGLVAEAGGPPPTVRFPAP